jgi:hypothetical protein
MQTLVQDALENREELPRWSQFLRLQMRSRESGLDKLTSMAEVRSVETHEIVPAFRFVFHNTLARSIFTDSTELSQAAGVTQELIRQQFAAADKEAIRLYSQRVAALIDQR